MFVVVVEFLVFVLEVNRGGFLVIKLITKYKKKERNISREFE
jgi:hypothetical protein